MLGIEPAPHQQAPAIRQADFNTRVPHRARRALSQLHFQELSGGIFTQAFLPDEEIRPTYPSLTAERSYRLPATRLFGNQLPPFRPSLLCAPCHGATLLHSGPPRKMWFVNRSLQIIHTPIRTCFLTCLLYASVSHN